MATSKETIEFFARLIENRTGIHYSEVNYYQLERRLEALSQKMGFPGVAELQAAMNASNKADLEKELLEEATNHETSFFRDVGIFKAFQECLLPEIKANKEKQGNTLPVAIWSSACSSGQEPYSLAMLCAESSFYNYQILCTDLSTKILGRAKLGLFSDIEIKRGLDETRRRMFFDEVVDGVQTGWKAKDSLRKQLEFRQHNLLSAWFGIGEFDIIFLRNVLIYQTVENKKIVVEKIFEHLRPKGFFIMGAAESLIGISERFEQRNYQGALFYQKK